MKRLLLFFFFLLIIFTTLPFLVKADEEEEIRKELETLKKALEESQKATRPLEESLKKLQDQLNQIKFKVKLIEEEIQKKENEVKKGEQVLSYQKNLLNQRVFLFYKNIKKNEQLFFQFLTGENLSLTLRNFFYQKNLIDQDKNTIIKIVLYIKNLEEKKQKLKEEKNSLAILKKDIDAQSQFLDQQIKKAKAYQEQLSKKIAELTEKQKEIIKRKFAENPIPRSVTSFLGNCSPDYDPLNDQIKKDSGFSPKFGFFSIGVPNKVGMNQYGAYGRAKKGQNYKDILLAYYNNVRFECRNFPNNKIRVKDTGEVDIKTYLKLLGEMDVDWNQKEAFKAQIVAAASYAYSYTNQGKNEICYDENCQIFLRCLYLEGRYKCGDQNEKPKNWQERSERQNWYYAVDEVNQECGDGVLVMVSNDTNEVITAWYSSTHGGVMLRSGEIGWNDKPWTKHGFDSDAPVNSLRDLLVNAYDGPNYGNSPWFYCNWGSRPEYNNTAWLKESEVLEIVNALILFKLDNSTLSHLSQVDKDIPDTWDDNKVREEIKNRGGQHFSSIYSIEAIWDGSGITHTLIIRGDIGERQYNAQEFKDIFNLRARGNLIILPACLITKSSEIGRCQSYALFDVVKK